MPGLHLKQSACPMSGCSNPLAQGTAAQLSPGHLKPFGHAVSDVPLMVLVPAWQVLQVDLPGSSCSSVERESKSDKSSHKKTRGRKHCRFKTQQSYTHRQAQAHTHTHTHAPGTCLGPNMKSRLETCHRSQSQARRLCEEQNEEIFFWVKRRQK